MYKKVHRHICQPSPGVELGGSKDCYLLKYYNVQKWGSRFTLEMDAAENTHYIKKCIKWRKSHSWGLLMFSKGGFPPAALHCAAWFSLLFVNMRRNWWKQKFAQLCTRMNMILLLLAHQEKIGVCTHLVGTKIDWFLESAIAIWFICYYFGEKYFGKKCDVPWRCHHWVTPLFKEEIFHLWIMVLPKEDVFVESIFEY